MDLDKLLKINNYLNENAYDLNYVEFLSLIGTTVDEYCAKNGLDVNETWENLNAVRKMVFDELGGADYVNLLKWGKQYEQNSQDSNEAW